MVTKVNVMLTLSGASTTPGVAVFSRAFPYLQSGCTADGDDTKILFAHCEHFHIEAFSRPKLSAKVCAPRRLSCGNDYRGSQSNPTVSHRYSPNYIDVE